MKICRIIAVGNRKGGVGKTTTVINLAYELSLLKKRVLVVDLDGQGNTTKTFIKNDQQYNISNVLLDLRFDIRKSIVVSEVEGKKQKNLHIIPAVLSDFCSKLEIDLFSLIKREERLKIQLDKIKHEYDFIIIDTSARSTTIGLNAVIAATEFIVTTEFKNDSLEGIDEFITHICDVKMIEEDRLKFKILSCKVDKREKQSFDYAVSYLNTLYPEKLFKVLIMQRSLFSSAEFKKVPVNILSQYEKKAPFYKKLAKEVTSE